jgi:hypothetical protein
MSNPKRKGYQRRSATQTLPRFGSATYLGCKSVPCRGRAYPLVKTFFYIEVVDAVGIPTFEAVLHQVFRPEDITMMEGGRSCIACAYRPNPVRDPRNLARLQLYLLRKLWMDRWAREGSK